MGKNTMITIEELKKIARFQSLKPYQQEKEYLQLVFLNSLSREKEFIFKGGTCLRLAYNYVRFSEDLDFNVYLGPNEIKEIVGNTLKSFALLGIEHKFVKEELFDKSYTSVIRFKGPLYANREDSTNSIRLDMGKRKTKTKEVIQIKEKFSDVPSFFIACMSQEEIIAEKIRALFSEAKPRHVFDVWTMKNQGIALNKELLSEKLNEDNIQAKEITFFSINEYELDIRDLVYPLAPYEQVLKEVKGFLASNKVIKR